MSDDRLHLIDANGFLHWKYHAAKKRSDLLSPDVGGLQGMLEEIDRILERGAEHVVAVMDSKRNWRKEKYPPYKAHRTAAEPSLTYQLEHMDEALEEAGIQAVTVDGFEGDDVLATLAKRHASDRDVVVYTMDKDLAQVVNDAVSIYNSRMQYGLDVAGVFEWYGVPPSRMVDYLALCGDRSDNVPGVAKWGEKTAQAAIASSDDDDDMLLKASRGELIGVSDRLQRILWDQKSNFVLSQVLIKVRTDVPLELDLAAAPTSIDWSFLASYRIPA